MKNIYILISLLFFTTNIQAQAFSLDTTFNLNYNFYFTGSGAEILGLNYEPDGKIMIYGNFNDGYNNPSDIIRIYEDGSIDNTWQYIYGGYTIPFIKRLNNNYIVLNSSFGMLFKLNYTGQITDTAWINNTFRDNICGGITFPYIFPDGSIYVGTSGSCLHPDSKTRYFKKFFPDGKMDTNFRHTTNGLTVGVIKYSSDKLLVYGYGDETTAFTQYDTIPANRMFRIDTLGNMDTTFKSIFTVGSPFPAYIQNDGKIIVRGNFQIKNDTNTLCLIRLNSDGSLDSTFNSISVYQTTNVFSGWINTICPTTDGGYLVGGHFTQYQGYVRNNIAKIDVNGFIDTVYFNGLGIDSAFHHNVTLPVYVNSIVKGNNDNYYVMGYFTHYNGVHVNPIIRIHGLSVGINENEKEDIIVYPNPANNQISFNTGTFKDYQLSIFNAIGLCVFQQYCKTTTSNINIQALKQGLYLYKLTDKSGKVINGKFVKN